MCIRDSVWAELPESYEGDSFAFSDEVMDKCDVFLTPGGIFGSELSLIHI